MNGILAVAFRQAIAPFHGKAATPQVVYRIKKRFLEIAKSAGIDLTAHKNRIRIEFKDGATPNLIIPPELLATH